MSKRLLQVHNSTATAEFYENSGVAELRLNGSPVISGAGVMRLPLFRPTLHAGTYDIGAANFTSPDEALVMGYNAYNLAPNEPVGRWVLEIDYPFTVRGVASTRTMEMYTEFKSEADADGRPVRPFFHSFVPNTGAETGFINYGYQLLGDGYLSTPGGGGYYYYTGNDPTQSNITIGGWDFDGFKPGNTNCTQDTFVSITTATAANPMVLTLADAGQYSPGSNISFWSVDAAGLANKGYTRVISSTEVKCVSISGNFITTDYDNTAAAITNALVTRAPAVAEGKKSVFVLIAAVDRLSMLNRPAIKLTVCASTVTALTTTV